MTMKLSKPRCLPSARIAAILRRMVVFAQWSRWAVRCSAQADSNCSRVKCLGSPFKMGVRSLLYALIVLGLLPSTVNEERSLSIQPERGVVSIFMLLLCYLV